MSMIKRRLWGIDVIAGIYGVATLLLIWVCFIGSDVGRVMGMILAPVSAVLCFGIAFRINVVRIGLLVLLAISLIGNGLLVLYFLSALAGIIEAPPNKEPREELLQMPFRIAATLTMFFYLNRSDVRDAFRSQPKQTVLPLGILDHYHSVGE